MNSDLDWILNSAQLMQAPEGIKSFKWLIDQMQAIPDAEHEREMGGLPNRLGIRYENLVEIILNKSLQLVVLERNIQVKKQNITLGEFDFIGATTTTAFHLECAIKFYLRVGSGNKLDDYIGPGKRDRLDIKWQRLINHQLPLSSTDEGKNTCLQYGISPKIKVLLLQGYLFHPFDEGIPASLAEGINPDHLRGWWLKTSEVEKLGAAHQFSLMEKPFWLTPKVTNPIKLNELKNLSQEKAFPLLVSRGEMRNDNWLEMDRGFVVPDSW